MHEKAMRMFEETSESEQSSVKVINAFVLSKDYSSNCVEFFNRFFQTFLYQKYFVYIYLQGYLKV